MSPDVSHFVSQEARRSNCSYCEIPEDHDISAMVFHFPEPLNLVLIGQHQRFWAHPVKLRHVAEWDRIWADETVRSRAMEGTHRLAQSTGNITSANG
jgi:hypothetical protein